MGNFETFRTFDGYDGLNKVLFCEPLCNDRQFYFYASPADCSVAVEVLSEKLLDLWRARRNNHHKQSAAGDINTWRLDSNLNANRVHYESASLRENAKPLAEVGFYWEKQLEVMHFPKPTTSFLTLNGRPLPLSTASPAHFGCSSTTLHIFPFKSFRKARLANLPA